MDKLSLAAFMIFTPVGVSASTEADAAASLEGVCIHAFAEVGEDGTLKHDEASALARAAFPKLDSDGNGVVDQAEFQACPQADDEKTASN